MHFNVNRVPMLEDIHLPLKGNKRSAIQWYFPFQSKLVFSANTDKTEKERGGVLWRKSLIWRVNKSQSENF